MKLLKVNMKIDQKEILSRLNFLRGLFATLIVIGHCSIQFDKEIFPFIIIHKFNMVGVCFFFYVSGMSLVYNFYNKQRYLKHFIRNKVVYLFIIALVAQILGDLLKAATIGCIFHLSNIILEFNWYIYEMLVFYIGFYVLYRFCKSIYLREIFLAFMTMGICLGTLYFYKYGTWTGWHWSYYISSFSFLWGVIMCEHYERINEALHEHILIYNIMFLTIALACCLSLNLPNDNLISALLKNLMGICIMTVLTSCCCFVPPHKILYISNILLFLTKCSTEIYLYQFCLLEIFSKLFRDYNFKIGISYILVVVVSVCIVSYLMHFVDTYISKLIKK